MSTLIRKILQEKRYQSGGRNESEEFDGLNESVEGINEAEVSPSDRALCKSSDVINNTAGSRGASHSTAEHRQAALSHRIAYHASLFTEDPDMEELHGAFSKAHDLTGNAKTKGDHRKAAEAWEEAGHKAKETGHVSFKSLADRMEEHHLNPEGRTNPKFTWIER